MIATAQFANFPRTTLSVLICVISKLISHPQPPSYRVLITPAHCRFQGRLKFEARLEVDRHLIYVSHFLMMADNADNGADKACYNNRHDITQGNTIMVPGEFHVPLDLCLSVKHVMVCELCQ